MGDSELSPLGCGFGAQPYSPGSFVDLEAAKLSALCVSADDFMASLCSSAQWKVEGGSPEGMLAWVRRKAALVPMKK